MEPVMFEGVNVTWAVDQPEYRALSAQVTGDYSVSCWKLSIKDLLYLAWTRRLWLAQKNFGQPLQPQLLSIHKPQL